jgi:hypothetical protein
MSNSKALTVVALLQEMEEALENKDMMDTLERVDGTEFVGFYTYDEENDSASDEYRIGTDDEDVSDIFDDLGFVYMNSVVDVFEDDEYEVESCFDVVWHDVVEPTDEY